MFEIIREMMEAWQDAQLRHAMMVHLPLALSLLGVPLAAGALLRPKSDLLRWMAVGAFALLTAMAYFTAESGHDAEAKVNPALTAAGAAVLEEHESRGERAWWFAAAATVALALTAIPRRRARTGASIVSIGLVLWTAGWIAVVGHHGGSLVYVYSAVAPALNSPDGLESGANPNDDQPADPRLAFFVSTVRPILRENCWGCHNPQRKDRFGHLDLTSMASILAGGESAPDEMAVVPGRPEDSLMILFVRYDDIVQMPPPKKGGKLPDEAIAALERWIAEGAVWQSADLPSTWPEDEDEGEDGDE